MEGRCPDSKTRKGRAGGQHDQHMAILGKLFEHLGCPATHAPSEAEGWCATLSCLGMADAVCSADCDVLPFGATGTFLEENDIDGSDSSRLLEIGES